MTDKFSHKLADNTKLAMSGLFITPDDATYDIIRVPFYGFVSDVWLEVTTAYIAGTPSITIGWKGNGETAQPSGFMSNDIAKPKELGLKRAQKDNLLSFPGKYFSSGSGVITVTIAAGSATTEGNFRVFAMFTVIR
jgi:hypothetical protein